MSIMLDCPWCEGSLRVDDGALDGEIRCAGCGVAFELASEEMEVAAQAA